MSDTAAPPTAHRGLGIACFVLALVATFLLFGVIGTLGYLTNSGQATPALKSLVGFILIGGFFLEVVAVVTGVIGLCDKTSKKAFAGIGVVISGAMIVLNLLLGVLGYSRLHSGDAAAAAGSGSARNTLTDLGCAEEGRLRSVISQRPSEIAFVNHSPRNIRVYWLDFEGRRVFYAEILPGASYVQKTRAPNPWLVAGVPGGECLGVFEAAAAPGIVVIGETRKPPRPGTVKGREA